MSDASTPDQRQAILDAAIAVLRDDGAAALTVRRVAAGAGCSTTGVYTWFGGKGGLVDALFVEGFERFDTALDAVDLDLMSQARAYRRWGLADSTYYLIMFGSAVPDHDPSERALERALRSFDRLVRVVAAELGPDRADERAYHLWATIHGYVMLELQGLAPPLPIDADEAYEHAIELVLSSVR